MNDIDAEPPDIRAARRHGPLLRWTIRILFMLLVSLISRAILTDPRTAAQVEATVAIIAERLKTGDEPPETRPDDTPSVPAVRAMPSNRVPVRRPGQSG